MNNLVDSPVLIASYPRSGNTLVRTVLFHCFGLKSGSMHPNDFHGNKELERYVGHIERHTDFPIGAISLIKTHELPKPADQGPVIYLVRDGRAACLSLYYFCNKRIPLAEIIAGQARLGQWHLAKWSDHIVAWNPWERPNTVIIRYEDLTDALPGVVDRLSQFLNRKPITDRIPPRDDIAAVDGRWVRSVSQRDASFPAELVDLFRQHHGTMMERLGYTMSETEKPAAAALQAKLNQGMTLHRQGKLTDAERCYGEVLQRQPDHSGALHLLGVIARQTRRTERAVELIKRAIELNPKVAAAHSNLGNALMDLKRSAEALASYDKAIVLNPDIAEAHSNRGNALMDLKHPTEALASYDRAIALKPEIAEAHSNRGNALKDLNRPTEALASYDRAIALKPDYAEAYNNRGNALKDLRRPTEALASYNRAIALKPDYAEAYSNRGAVLMDLRHSEGALASYDRAIALKPDVAEAHSNRGNGLRDLKRPAEALASYDKAIALKPEYAEAHSNRGAVLMELTRPMEALASYDKA